MKEVKVVPPLWPTIPISITIPEHHPLKFRLHPHLPFLGTHSVPTLTLHGVFLSFLSLPDSQH